MPTLGGGRPDGIYNNMECNPAPPPPLHLFACIHSFPFSFVVSYSSVFLFPLYSSSRSCLKLISQDGVGRLLSVVLDNGLPDPSDTVRETAMEAGR